MIIERTNDVTQPRLSLTVRQALHELDLKASCYQPATLFIKNGRKLPNCAEPGDPWECFLRHDGLFGVVSKGIGATADDSVLIALQNRPGLSNSIRRLSVEIDLLVETMQCL